MRGCDRGNNEVPVNPSTFHKLRCEKVEQKITTTSSDSNGGSIKNYFYLNVQVCI